MNIREIGRLVLENRKKIAAGTVIGGGALLEACQGGTPTPSAVDIMNAQANQTRAAAESTSAAAMATLAAPSKTPDFDATGVAFATRTVAPTGTTVPEAATTPSQPEKTAEPTNNGENAATGNSLTELTDGKAQIAGWGYGPFGKPGEVYPKIAPDGQLPLGNSQGVTDFNGRNWEDHGTWCWDVPQDAKHVFVLTQGDAPGEFLWRGQRVCLTTSADITNRAPMSLDNAPKTGKGSSGVSGVFRITQ